MKQILIITNNPLIVEKYLQYEMIVKQTMEEVLIQTRDLVHLGHKLLTHPLASSVKPNETPYRTVVVTSQPVSSLDMQSLAIIEGAIATTNKFLKMGKTPNWTKDVLKDFQVIDYDLIYHVLN